MKEYRIRIQYNECVVTHYAICDNMYEAYLKANAIKRHMKYNENIKKLEIIEIAKNMIASEETI